MIPKKIHYCWFGGKPLPNDVKKCIKSWKKYCPDYEIIRWDESNFDINCNQFIKDAYEAKAWAFVSDYARLKIIYEQGGIYLDTDVELLRNLDDLLTNKSYFPVQQCDNIINTGLGFGAEKGSKIIRDLLKEYNNLKFDENKKEQLACPLINNIVFKRYGFESSNLITYLDNGNVTIYPPKYFDPISPGDSKNLMNKETYSIHHYNASWMSKRSVLKRKIVRMIGQHNVIKIKKIFSSIYHFLKDKFGYIFILLLIFYNAFVNILKLETKLSYLDEIVEICLFLYSGVYILKKHKQIISKQFKKIYFLFFIILSIGILGNIFNNYMPYKIAIIKDIIQFLKFPLSLILLEQIGFWDKFDKSIDKNVLLKIVKVFVGVILLLGIISLFENIGLSQMDDIRSGIHSYQFLFSHPTYLVLSSIFMLALIDSLERSKKSMIYSIMLLLIIILTMRTKGFMIAAVYLFIKCFYNLLKNNKLIFFIIMIVISLFIAKDKLELYASFSNSPRESLYKGALKLANNNFPIGSGFGTFASHISGKYSSRVYDFIYVPYYTESNGESINILGDAGIPYYVGQFGYIGFILFAYLIYLIFKLILLDVSNKPPLLLLIMYILVAITSETIVINCGMELALVISFVRCINKKNINSN